MFSSSARLYLFVPLMFIPLMALSCLTTADGFRAQIISSTETFLNEKAKKVALMMNASHYQVKVRPMAEGAKLPPCKTPVQLKDFSQKSYGEQTLQASCTGHWQLQIKGRIQLYLPVIISTRTIPVNRFLNESDIEWQTRDISILTAGYLTQPRQAINRYARVEIKKNTPLNQNMLSSGAP